MQGNTKKSGTGAITSVDGLPVSRVPAAFGNKCPHCGAELTNVILLGHTSTGTIIARCASCGKPFAKHI